MDKYEEILKRKKINYHLFKSDGVYFIFDNDNLIYETIDEIAYNIFRKLKKEIKVKSVEEESYYKVIVALAQKGLFFVDKWEDKYIEETAITQLCLSFPTIHECNLNCSYCFAKSGRNYSGNTRVMKIETLRKTLEFFVDNFKQINFIRIDFVSGGEPLLNFELIKNVVQELKSLRNIEYKIWVCTNGTLLTKENESFLSQNDINIGISIDGPEEIHDKKRYFHDGEGSYKVIEKNVKDIISNRALSRKFKELWSLTTVTEDTKNILDLLKHYYKLGFRNSQFRFVRGEKELSGAISGRNIDYYIELYT